MTQNIKYVHTNLIANNWKKLSEFYINVFGCKPVYPERNMSGEWLDGLTNINNVYVNGIHLQLPGYGNDAPTLEIFEYNVKDENSKPKAINNFGFSHIAFRVENVEELIEKIVANGGEKYGEFVETTIQGVGKLMVIYMKDPEDNIIELQHWEK